MIVFIEYIVYIVYSIYSSSSSSRDSSCCCSGNSIYLLSHDSSLIS
jgi:hypothetical protein